LIELKIDFGLIHIPKTAGRSITRSFKTSPHYLMNEMHKPYKKLKQSQKDSFIFLSVVRNPFDRIFSFYHFFLGGSVNRKFLLGFDKDFDISFEDYVNQIRNVHQHIKPSWDFVTEDDVIKVNEILYFENLHEDFEKMCLKYDLNLELAWEHKNVEKPQFKREGVYKPYQIKLIEHVFRKDFENFGYSYESWLDSESFIS
jgi:hypothetical protein